MAVLVADSSRLGDFLVSPSAMYLSVFAAALLYSLRIAVSGCRGDEALTSNQNIDAQRLYEQMFGSEAFEAFIGHMSVATACSLDENLEHPNVRVNVLRRFKMRVSSRVLACLKVILEHFDLPLEIADVVEALRLFFAPLGKL